MVESRKGIAFLGNPGSGKSTILNTILEDVKSSSGVSTAKGLTEQVLCFETENMLYFDTPGLNDFKKRKLVGEDIQELLERKKSLRLIFVIKTTSGRVNPEDTLTIKIILDCIKGVDLTNRFGILVNQVTESMMEALSDPKEDSILRECLTQYYKTKYIEYVPFDKDAYDANDVLLKPYSAAQIRKFIALLPETKPAGTVIERIKMDDYDQRLMELIQVIEDLQKGIKEQNMAIAQDKADYEKEKNKLQAQIDQRKNDSMFTLEKFEKWVKKVFY